MGVLGGMTVDCDYEEVQGRQDPVPHRMFVGTL